MIPFNKFFRLMESNSIHPETPIHVINSKTKEIVWKGVYSKRNIARRAVDRKDNKYGAYIHKVVYPKGMDYTPPILEYRKNLADGSPAPSIQAHNGKDPNSIDKKYLFTKGDRKHDNPKMDIPGSILTLPELEEMGIKDFQSGKTLFNFKNSNTDIQMFTNPQGQWVGRVIKH